MKYIAYYRVSTNQQGLGIDAQKTIVNNTGFEIIEEFVEYETGTNKKNRPILMKSIEKCGKEHTLIIAKLDRLARDVEFIAKLMNTKVKFYCCDIPDMNPFTIHIVAAMAEMEAKRISSRTKEALGELKKRGIKLGGIKEGAIRKDGGVAKAPFGDRKIAVNSIKRKSVELNRIARGYAKSLRDGGMTFADIASRLNNEGLRTYNGCMFMPSSVKRLCDNNLEVCEHCGIVYEGKHECILGAGGAVGGVSGVAREDSVVEESSENNDKIG